MAHLDEDARDKADDEDVVLGVRVVAEEPPVQHGHKHRHQHIVRGEKRRDITYSNTYANP